MSGLLFAVFALPGLAQDTAGTAERDSSDPPKSFSAQIGIDLKIGYGDADARVKVGFWYPLWVTVEALEYDLQGQILVYQEGNPLQAKVRFDVPLGSSKRYLTYYRFSRSGPNIIMEVDAKRLGTEIVTLPLTLEFVDTVHLMIVTDHPGTLAFFKKLVESAEFMNPEGVGEIPVNPVPGPSPAGTVTAAVAPALPVPPPAPLPPMIVVQSGSLDLLPEVPIGLDPLDAIILDTEKIRSITEGQWDALQTWVSFGGRLLLAGGRFQPFIEQSHLAGAFGISLSRAEPASPARILRLEENPNETDGEIPVAWPREGWDQIRLGDRDNPFLVSKRVGRGWFHLCAAALSPETLQTIQRSLDGRKSNPSQWWRAILEPPSEESPFAEIAREAAPFITPRLQFPFAADLARARWIFAYLGLYIFFAVVVNWWLCRRLGRPASAWAVALLLAAAFSGYAYWSGSRVLGKVSRISELTLISRSAGDDVVRATTFTSIFFPRFLRTDLVAPPREAIFARPDRDLLAGELLDPFGNPYGVAGSPPGPNSSPPARTGDTASGRVIDLASASTRLFSVSFGAKASVEDFLLLPWSPRNLISESTFPLSGAVEVSEPIQWDRVSDQLDGVLLNATPWAFKRWWLCRGPKVWLGDGPLPPGSEADLSDLKSERVHLPGKIGEALTETFLKPPRGVEPSQLSEGDPPTAAAVQAAPFPAGAGTSPSFAISPLTLGAVSGPAGALPIQTVEVQEKAFWSQLGLGREMSPSHIGFTFFGEAERSVSPLLSRFKPDESLGLLFYLQDLSDTVIRSLPSGMNWTLFLSLTGRFESAWPVHSLHTPAESQRIPARQGLRSGFVSFPAALISIYLVPQILPFSPAEDAVATIGFVLTSDPKDHPYGVPDRPDRTFKVAGCPVSVYNARADIWDDLGIWTGGPMTLSPLSDYLDPETYSVHLRIDASPDEIRWAVLEATEDDRAEMMKGSELFGAFGPQSRPYRLGENTIYPPQLQLQDFTVSFAAQGQRTQ